MALVLGLVLVVVLVRLVGGDDGGGAGADPGDREQRTLLVQVQGQSGEPAFANAVLAVDPAVMLSVPAGLVTDVPGRGSVTLAETIETNGGGPRAQAALTDQLELVIDHSWVLDGASLAGLVDSVGGVTVDVDVDVRGTAPGGGAVVVVPAGDAQLLDGAAATSFAGHLRDGEPEQVRLARFAAVLQELLAGLPADVGEVGARLAGLPGSTTTQGDDELAALLLDLRAAITADAVSYPTLPVLDDEVGAEEPTLRIDRAAAERVVATHFADSRPAAPPGGKVTVLVQNGVGAGGLLEQARLRLRAADLTFEHGGNANRFGYERTVVVVPDDSAESRARGRLVTQALGVPDDAVVTGSQGAGVADVVVVLGADFRA